MEHYGTKSDVHTQETKLRFVGVDSTFYSFLLDHVGSIDSIRFLRLFALLKMSSGAWCPWSDCHPGPTPWFRAAKHQDVDPAIGPNKGIVQWPSQIATGKVKGSCNQQNWRKLVCKTGLNENCLSTMVNSSYPTINCFQCGSQCW